MKNIVNAKIGKIFKSDTYKDIRYDIHEILIVNNLKEPTAAKYNVCGRSCKL